MAQSKKIGFPAGMLGEDPMRFDVLAEASPSFVAIGKSADILLDSYLGSPKEKSVMLAMRETPDKPEFKRLGINSPYAVNQLDFEISGAAIIACDKDTANEMRNEIWSGAMKFEYLLLAKSAQASQASFDVDLLFTDEVPENVRLGKSFRVQIELGQPERALVVGRGNFYQQTGGRWIYKLNADKTRAVKVPIQIGRQNPVQYEIVEGLQPGDWVITTGYDNFGDVEELVF